MLFRSARYEDAYREIGLGIDLAVAAGREDVARRLRDEQQLVEKHAGRVLSAPAEQTSAHLPR